ncbi:MAG: sugar phosphate isomerase/epimerase [Planctomycetes bacterium]|nr:sugar phosphate isomerase/epimerase [Planctomycetota bacterium]
MTEWVKMAARVGLVKDRVVHVHASDRDAELEHTVVGEGVVDFPAIFRVLKHEASFDGWISLEAGGARGEEGIRDGVEYVRRAWEEA